MIRSLMIVLAAFSLAACQPKGGTAATGDQGAAAKAFLAKTAKEPGVVTLPDGLEYKVISSGPANGLKPHINDEVKVNYEGKLIDGTVFDSSYERGQPAAMPLKNLVKAWQEALVKMKPGDVWMLYVPPELGYGAEGQGPIPPNSALIFKIELIDFLPGPGSVGNG
ncbi:MAG TPA: FKBP-type peptidyl-prolyl cis-trans isomerase [Phenylobacterium sp.]|jgi:peptidylprolyl isomerase/FKBP-type peptidyl-prolyl cis-trans isomerase FklB|nr:FKBP-type peptidyl-prolyl cis-trans isomerase [Phenylobacterium sp.]